MCRSTWSPLAMVPCTTDSPGGAWALFDCPTVRICRRQVYARQYPVVAKPRRPGALPVELRPLVVETTGLEPATLCGPGGKHRTTSA